MASKNLKARGRGARALRAPATASRQWRDRLFLGVAWVGLIALALAWSTQPLGHDDLFGHLRTGEWIRAHRQVPHADVFSFTRAGTPWVAHEWLFSLLSWGVWSVGGYAALLALGALLVLAIGWAVARQSTGQAQPATSPALLIGLLALAAWAVSQQIVVRAALVSELLLALLLLCLARFRQTGARRWLGVLPPLFWLWGNVHSGVIFGLFVLGLFTLEAWLGSLLHSRWPRLAPALRAPAPRDHLAAFGAAALASLANPNGWRVWTYPFELSRLLFASDIPWQLGHFAAMGLANDWGALAILGLLVAGSLRRHALARISLAELIAIVTFLGLCWRTPRFVFHLVILAVPVACRLWTREGRRETSSRLATLAVAAAALVPAAALWHAHPWRPIDLRFPAGAVKLLAEEEIRGRPFHHQNFGGYLSWRTRMPIFWDGRNDVFAALAREVATVPFAEIVRRYDIDLLLLSDFEWERLRSRLSASWVLVYWDDSSALYLRRDRWPAQAARLELHHFDAFGGRRALGQLARDPVLEPAARAELDRLIALRPDNQRALYFRGLLSRYRGDLAAARRDLEAALAVRESPVVREQLAELR